MLSGAVRDRWIGRGVQYFWTNEELDSIVDGLEIAEGDRILAVCGAGDQAFAMASRGATVVAVDINPAQTDYAMWRACALIEGDVEGFLSKNPNANIHDLRERRRLQFLRRKDIQDRIRESLLGPKPRLSFEVGDIFDALTFPPESFEKFYLSNVPGYFPSSFARLPKPGTLVYTVKLMYERIRNLLMMVGYLELPKNIIGMMKLRGTRVFGEEKNRNCIFAIDSENMRF